MRFLRLKEVAHMENSWINTQNPHMVDATRIRLRPDGYCWASLEDDSPIGPFETQGLALDDKDALAWAEPLPDEDPDITAADWMESDEWGDGNAPLSLHVDEG